MKKFKIILLLVICSVAGTRSISDVSACPAKSKCLQVKPVEKISGSETGVFAESFNTWVEFTRFRQ